MPGFPGSVHWPRADYECMCQQMCNIPASAPKPTSKDLKRYVAFSAYFFVCILCIMGAKLTHIVAL